MTFVVSAPAATRTPETSTNSNGIRGTASRQRRSCPIRRASSAVDRGVHGWGVFALETIAKNKRIVDYAGEQDHGEAEHPARGAVPEAGPHLVLQAEPGVGIDAAVGGNVARFINHSCKPNCYSQIIDGVIWIRASRTIRKGEELYSYNTEGTAEISCRCRPGCQGML